MRQTFGGLAVILMMVATGCDQSPSPPETPSPTRPSGAAFDKEAATAELDRLSLQLQALFEHGGDLIPLLNKTRQFVDRYPKIAAGRVLLGQLELTGGNSLEAARQFELSLELNPRQPEVQLLAGTIALKTGDLDRAERHFSQAIGLDTSNALYRVHLARVYLKRRQFDKAEQTALEAIHLDSTSDSAYATLSDVYARQNKISLAINQLDHALKLTIQSPQRHEIYLRPKAALQRRNNQPRASLVTLKQLPATKLITMPVSKELAACWAILGEPQTAAKHFEQIVLMQPSNDAALAAASEWFIKADDEDSARRMLNQLRKVNPRHEAIPTLHAKLNRDD